MAPRLAGTADPVDPTDPGVRRAVLGVLLPGFTGTQPPSWVLDAARDGLAGVVLFAHNTPDVATAAGLTTRLHEASPGLLVAVDEEGGDVSRLEAGSGSSLPGAAALGLVDDERLTHEAGAALGRLLAAVGVDLDLAPVLDVDVPGNPVIGVRAFGDVPERVARHGLAFARGLHRGGAGTCAKHFPGHGGTTTDSHLELPVVTASLDALRRRDLLPFVEAFAPDADGRAGVDALMTAHVVVPDLGPGPASLEPATVRLARDLGFDGPVITDALDMGAVSDGAHVGEAAVRAVEAGADLLCLGTTAGRDDEGLFRDAVGALADAVAAGRIGVQRLQDSAARTAAAVATIRARRRRAGAETGPEAARAALRELGEVGRRAAVAAVRPLGVGLEPLSAAPEVVDLRLRLDHAAGRRSEQVQHAVARRWPDAVVHPPLDDERFAGLLAAWREETPGLRRPLVVVTREPVPGTPEGDRLTAILACRGEVHVVHTGTPAAHHLVDPVLRSRPGAGVVLACGTGRANAEAAVDLLARGTGGPAQSPPTPG
ncbi:beta-N-acetylhexosaminidase [Isoptericola sp. CG 20/1183]|uniref:Beta-N-acetylhexosaminidase n=1 Tax=Isoptericola halotolerans TaxID=300560 RepID=A0ABX5ECK3_9MICO|nr:MULTISPECIES: glycoside hydrolase family 3 N-terminal domain-containing protein [Isoptericola]PRZ05227.1 beta-N-acetylhexosaminidase [Isoptericola halotolerans]PRZ05965.1 beta-N-acetylhexosaminidase [Isoptericola sp. CG 20/1183]